MAKSEHSQSEFTPNNLIEKTNKLLLEQGFILYYDSKSSESKYYEYPQRKGLLRLSSHKCRDSKTDRFGINICGRITFSLKECNTNGKIKISDPMKRIALGIGNFFLKSQFLN